MESQIDFSMLDRIGKSDDIKICVFSIAIGFLIGYVFCYVK